VPYPSKAKTHAWLETERERVKREYLDTHYVMLPLYLYDHSGITMSTSGFSCPWDSGQVGWIYCTMERARQEWSGTDDEVRVRAKSYLYGEVEEYDQFLTGDVWGYVIKDEDDEEVDSCWGFYGLDYCREAAKEAVPSAREAA